MYDQISTRWYAWKTYKLKNGVQWNSSMGKAVLGTQTRIPGFNPWDPWWKKRQTCESCSLTTTRMCNTHTCITHTLMEDWITEVLLISYLNLSSFRYIHHTFKSKPWMCIWNLLWMKKIGCIESTMQQEKSFRYYENISWKKIVLGNKTGRLC